MNGALLQRIRGSELAELHGIPVDTIVLSVDD